MAERRKQPLVAQRLARGDLPYPDILLARFGENAPAVLTAIGAVALLANRKTALFCSARPPAIGKPFCLCGPGAAAFVAMVAFGKISPHR